MFRNSFGKSSGKTFVLALAAASLLVFTGVAGAHPGHDLRGGFSAGVQHPFTGIDHILAMVAVGICAAQIGGRAIWLLPSTFLGLMIVGGAMGIAGAQVPMVEQGIAASVLILGLLVAMGSRVPLFGTMMLVGLFAIFHGFAHGAEMHDGLAPTAYAGGFILATAILHAIGVGTGMLLKFRTPAAFSRITGGAIAICGLALFLI